MRVKHNLPYIYTDKEVTPWGGMLLIKEFYDRIGMHEQLVSLPLMEKGSGRGIDHHEIIESFIMSVILGANNCTAAAQLSYDHVLKEIFQWEHGMPSQSSLSRFFPKYDGELSDLIFSQFNQWWHNALDYNNMTLDVDSTVITRFGEQEGAELGYNPRYKGRKSHHPILAFLAEPKMVANSWIRSGNSASNTEFIEFLQNTFTMVPRHKVSLLRGDSGFCSNKIFRYLEGIALDYIIAAPMKAGLVDHILTQKQWLTTQTKGIDICSFEYKAQGWGKKRRVVVVRKDTLLLPKSGGKTLFSQQDDYLRYRYSAFVTTSKYSDEIVWKTYNQRADAENQIKELKYDYNIAGFNFKDMDATEFAFRWITVAYNLMSYIRNAIMVSKVNHRLSTLRFNCIAIGAYLRTSARKTTLVMAVKGKKRDYIEKLFQNIKRFKPPDKVSIA